MLSDYKGLANDTDLFRFLVGEKIIAVFYANRGLRIVVESGDAFVLCQSGGLPAFWKEPKSEWEHHVIDRRKEIESALAALRDLPGVELP